MGLAKNHIDQDNDNDKNDNGKNNVDVQEQESFSGTVTAVGSTSFNFKAEDGTMFTVDTSNAKIVQAFGSAITLNSVVVGDNAKVNGTVNGNIITASRVMVTPPNTHKAVGAGTVTAVNGNSFTLKTDNHGIISSATVNTSASTTIISQNGATTTSASILVGSQVLVKGLWDELLNVLNAIKIRIIK